MTERLPESPTPQELQEFVKQHVYVNQTGLINHLLYGYDEANEFSISDIRNSPSDSQEILEWWLVSTWLANRLENHNQPLLCNDFGVWWGRTCGGQAIYLDSAMEEIYMDTIQSSS